MAGLVSDAASIDNECPIWHAYCLSGSHIEFLKMLDLYSKKYSEDELPYHIIVPSLPGYSLSSGPPLNKDWLMDDMGRVLNSLMVGLGFGSGYIAQGGDIGSFECRVLAALHDECKGKSSTRRMGIDPD